MCVDLYSTYTKLLTYIYIAQSAEAIEYTDYIFAEG